MYELLDYLNGGKCLVFFGSGPSCEIGLPDWRRLASKVLEAVTEKNPTDLDTYEALYAQEKYTEMLGRAWRKLTAKIVLDSCAFALSDTNKAGATYEFLVDFGFKGYLTTNLESVLKRHFDAKGVASLEFGNSRSDLELVDFDASTCIVKLHGDLGQPDSLVLTEDQYDQFVIDPSREYWRAFVRSYLASCRVLFIGYSLRDPDLQFLLKQATAFLRRKVPLYAIVPNASDDDCDAWDRKYNIRIFRYSNPDGSHRQLKQLFETLRRFVAMRGEAAVAASPIPMEVAQALFMWHRFQQHSGAGARVDAFQSLVLAAMARAGPAGSPLSRPEIAAAVAKVGGMDEHRIAASVGLAVDQAVAEKLLEERAGELFAITDHGIGISGKYAGQFENLKREFLMQVELDFRKPIPHLRAADIKSLSTAVMDSVMSTFAQRGAEIVQGIFGGAAMRPSGNLLKIISGQAQQFSEALKFPFINYVTDLLTKPQGVQERFLEYLSKAFFAIQALDSDPDGSLIRKELISNHCLVVDSNVLIPVLALNSARHDSTVQILGRARASGIKTIVTPRIFDEAMGHLAWAGSLVSNHGEQSIEVLSAALGRGRYKANAFLDGFIRYCNDVKEIQFRDYVEKCVGGEPLPRTVKRRITDFGLEHFPTHRISSRDQSYFAVKDETYEWLREELEARPEIHKSQERLETEAEVCATILLWRTQRPEGMEPDDWRCSFLTYASFLNRIAHDGPHPAGRNLTVRPDVLYEFLGRLEPVGDFRVPLKEVMLSTYFHSAEYFIDKRRYARFFSPLLKQAEEIYRDSLGMFRQLVSSSLTAESLLQVEELERPFAVAGLNARADDALRSELNRVIDENEQMRRELAKLHARRAKRRRGKRRR